MYWRCVEGHSVRSGWPSARGSHGLFTPPRRRGGQTLSTVGALSAFAFCLSNNETTRGSSAARRSPPSLTEEVVKRYVQGGAPRGGEFVLRAGPCPFHAARDMLGGTYIFILRLYQTPVVVCLWWSAQVSFPVRSHFALACILHLPPRLALPVGPCEAPTGRRRRESAHILTTESPTTLYCPTPWPCRSVCVTLMPPSSITI